MKLSRNQVRHKAFAIPLLRFEDQKPTSFARLILFQLLFPRLNLRERLVVCFVFDSEAAATRRQASFSA
jgi:hypothetical protein